MNSEMVIYCRLINLIQTVTALAQPGCWEDRGWAFI